MRNQFFYEIARLGKRFCTLFRALAFRREFPPFAPPNLPSAAAWGFFG